MRLLISNMLASSQDELYLEERCYNLGSAPTNDILLDSSFVSGHQAQLYFDGVHFCILSVGSAETKLNGKSLHKHVPYPFAPGDELTIAQFQLGFDRMSQDEDLEAESVAEAETFHALERRIHTELIERLDLRKLNPKALAPMEYRRLVETALDQIIEEETQVVSDELLDHVILLVMRHEISMRHLNAQQAGQSELQFKQFEDFVDRVYTTGLNKLGGSEQRSVDLEDLEQWVLAHYKDFRYDLVKRAKSRVLCATLRQNLLDTWFGLGPLEPLLKLPNITEIMVVHPRLIYVERGGIIQKTGRQFLSDEVAKDVIEKIVSPLGRRVDRNSPVVNARLPDGSRVNVVIPPLALRGPCLTIRKFSKVPLTMKDLIEDKHALTAQVSEFLKASVRARKNVIVSGGTGAGKTTLLNCLSEYISPRERIVTIEDSAELQLKQEHVVSLEARAANVQGEGAFPIKELVINALRMRPDRIIVGECRGKEALDMLQAMNTGHDGSMSTAHANSPADMVRRLEIMVLQAEEMPIIAVREQIASALDLIVQYTRFGDGARRVTQVSEVVKLDRETGEIIVEDIFKFRHTQAHPSGVLRHTGYIPEFFVELLRQPGVSLNLLFATEDPAPCP